MRFASCFSGIEAASVAWKPLGWECVAVAEVEKFPSAVLAHHYPDVPNLGDVTADDFIDRVRALQPDILVGGPPCQDFSVAGLRAGLAGSRGNLSLRWVQIIDAIRPLCSVTENVPGWLSVNKGHAFGAFLAAVVGHDTALVPPAECGGRWTDAGMVDGPKGRAAWRILDAQYFSLAQRRARVFVVASPRDGIDPAAVLLEQEGVCRNTPPRREARKGTAAGTFRSTERSSELAHTLKAEGHDASEDGTGRGVPLVAARMTAFGEYVDDGTASTLKSRDFKDATDLIAHAFDARQSDVIQYGDRTGQLDTDGHSVAVAFHANLGTQGGGIEDDGKAPPLRVSGEVAVAFSCKDHGADAADIARSVGAMSASGSHANGGGQVAVAWSIMPQNSGKDYKARPVDVAQPLMAGGPVGGNQSGDFIQTTMQVRRLTPEECEALQGFPRGYTNIPWRGKGSAPDGPRYKALGNSFAVPVVQWIGRRIAMVEALDKTEAA